MKCRINFESFDKLAIILCSEYKPKGESKEPNGKLKTLESHKIDCP